MVLKNFFPFPPPHSLAAVYDDILWLDSLLQHALFGMLTSTSKQAWRLNLKVANALFVVVQETVAILIQYFLVGVFHSLQKKNNQTASIQTGLLQTSGKWEE